MRRINRYIPLCIQNFLYERKESNINQEEFRKWESLGRPVPPPHLEKQKIIERYAREYSCKTLIETGTYLGDTVYSQKNNFARIISIELSRRFFKAARRRFRKDRQVSIMFGNSGDLLPDIMPGIESRSMMWLDGHYSGGLTAKGETESPIFKELDAVFRNNRFGHVILIDDARLFIGQRDYPTMDELHNFIKGIDPEYNIATESDIIILTKPQT